MVISFAGEDREIAKNLAGKLQNKLVNDRTVKVFYDEFYKSELWGKELTEYFQKAYGHDSRFIVLLLSKYFATAGARGILIGIALGALTTGLRVLFGVDRPYGGN